MHYTAFVKHASFLSFMSTIAIAVLAVFFIAKNQRVSQIQNLLSSPAITDKLAGINMTTDVPFETAIELLVPLLQDENEAAEAAQRALVVSACKHHNLPAIEHLGVDPALLDAATWWETDPKVQTTTKMPTDTSLAPSINHLAWFLERNESLPFSELIQIPLRDRDGSVLLGVLAIEKIGTLEELQELITLWATDVDVERNKAALLLAGLIGAKSSVETHQNELTAIQEICNESNYTLAWRTMHEEDGTVNPDIALAGMLANADRFFPVVIESAEENKWEHPEHPIVLAIRFAPNIANRIPMHLLQNDETRTKWWSLFSCGLLLEGR
jgi:hypothetical protein